MEGVLVRVLQRNRTKRIYMDIDIYIYRYTHTHTKEYIYTYCKELAHMIMETGKSPDLLSPCWRTRKAKV